MSEINNLEHLGAFVGAHRRNSRGTGKWTRGAKDRNVRVITRGSMRGKRVSSFNPGPTLPTSAIGRKTVGAMIRAERKHEAVLKANYSDLEQRLARVRARFYRLPG